MESAEESYTAITVCVDGILEGSQAIHGQNRIVSKLQPKTVGVIFSTGSSELLVEGNAPEAVIKTGGKYSVIFVSRQPPRQRRSVVLHKETHYSLECIEIPINSHQPMPLWFFVMIYILYEYILNA